MANRFFRTQSDATWTTGNYVTLPPDWRDLSRKVFKSVNGDKGGVWAPRSYNATIQRGIKIAGSGLQVKGLTKIDFDGRIRFQSGAQLILGNNDWPLLGNSHVGRARSITTSTLGLQTRSRYHWLLNRDYMAMQSVACTIQLGNGPTLIRPEFSLSIRVHNGGKLNTAELSFRVSRDFQRLPYLTPKIRIIRVDEYGTVEALKSVASGADASGYVAFPMPETPSTWYAGGESQVITYECDQNNTIDTSLYRYYAHVVEEQSTNVAIPVEQMDGLKERSLWFITLAYFDACGSTIPNSTNNGTPVGVAHGEVFALMGEGGGGSNNGVGNGVYIYPTSTNDWSRWSSLDNVKGLLLAASRTRFEGVVKNANSIWELANPNALTEGTQIYRYPTPQGNIYHSVTCHFDSIFDMRPQ